MNVESAKSKSNQRSSDKPQNTSDKVREIQQRQKNWLKQRAAETACDSDDSLSSSYEKFNADSRSSSAYTKSQSIANRQAVGRNHGHGEQLGQREPPNHSSQKTPMHDGREDVWRSGKQDSAAAVSSVVSAVRTEIRSHQCPVCSQLMVAPHHIPMLTVPCGHSMCDRCCRAVEYCPVCECYIESSTCNVMLQKIVTDYQRHLSLNSGDKTTERSRQRGGRTNNFLGREEEMDNMSLRREVLLEEQKSVRLTIQQIDDQIKKEHKQIDHIDREREKIQQQIQDLQLRQSTLADHRQQYVDKCEELADRRGNAESKLALLKSTLVDLQLETERLAARLPVDDVT